MNRRSFFKQSLVGSVAAVVSPLVASLKPKIKSKQKFLRGQRVRIGEMPPCISHFYHNTEAIVMDTYRGRYGGGSKNEYGDDYTLFIFNKDGTSYGPVSWYKENQLTLVDDDRDKGEQIIQNYLELET
jgi:hypothetical protein